MGTKSKLAPPASTREPLVELYHGLLRIRRSEEALVEMFARGDVPGFIHSSIGQEAISVGVMSALTREDTITSTHRGHGHAIAKGLSLKGFFSELLGRDDGLCRGRGGSMHVADMSVGMLGANGIVGAGIPIALGSALAHKSRRNAAIAVAFFGDGALAEGIVHECLNLAALWRLPILFVCENNGWGEFLPTDRQLAFSLKDLSGAYAIPYRHVDGNDVEAVASACAELAPEVRTGAPMVLECATTRVRGHFEGDPQKYRPPEDQQNVAKRDPVELVTRRLSERGMSAAQIESVATEVASEVAAAIAHAVGRPEADFASALADVYSPKATAL